MTGLRISVTVLPAGDGGCTVITLAGEADVTTTTLRDALSARVAEGMSRLLLVDMSELSFIDSGAVQMIIAAYQVFRRNGGTLMLVRPTPRVARVLELLGISRLITVYDSMDEALASHAMTEDPGAANRQP